MYNTYIEEKKRKNFQKRRKIQKNELKLRNNRWKKY